ncbi:hypothetical protein DER46DRAFT_566928 [Fusarium sp. MPI-SDFR-AT-0072]|nr:hypothetical protein DER46DRAFT_566928 [Fusarium sp. MPI-SDFR-AT-0072]
MPGRLRMSVNQAKDSFIYFSKNVFGHPRLFHVTSAYFRPRAKYSAVKACEAFKTIITSRVHPTVRDALSLNLSAQRATFAEAGGGTRTITISYHVKNDGERAHIWRGYYNPDSNTSWDHSANIWEVALATFATPSNFDAIEINGATYRDGNLVANNPSYRALREVYHSTTRLQSFLSILGQVVQSGPE